MYNTLIVGAGQLGSRHLQSLKKSKIKQSIFVYDLYESSLKNAKKRYDEVINYTEEHQIVYTDNIAEIPNNIDFAVIATTAKDRENTIIKFLNHCKIKYLIIEKVLFQNIEAFDMIKNLLNHKNTKAWVNCPRRIFNGYKELSEFFLNKKIHVIVDGSNLGLCCNSIHYIDFISFLTNDSKYKITSTNLSDNAIDSKRSGFKELTGIFTFSFSNGSTGCITSRNTQAKGSIMISSDTKKIIIFEDENKMILYDSTNKNGIEKKIGIRYQSELTSEVFELLMNNGNCCLTPYNESAQIHLPFIKMMIEHFSKIEGNQLKNCPIT